MGGKERKGKERKGRGGRERNKIQGRMKIVERIKKSKETDGEVKYKYSAVQCSAVR